MIGSGVLLIAAIVVGTWLSVSHSRNRALTDSERELGNITVAVAEQTDQAFGAMELVQLSVIERIRALGIASSDDYERLMSTHDVHVMLKHKISGLPHVSAIEIINAQGKLVNFSRNWPPPPVNVRDRDYFKALAAEPQLTSLISAPVRNRVTGTWTIYLARKVRAANGEFLGLVLGAIELQYFEKFFSTVALDPASSIALFRSDGVLLARYPRVDSLIGQNFGANALAMRLVKSTSRGVGRQVGIIDDQERIIAAHSVMHYPILIAATRTVEASLAEWRRMAQFLIAAAVLGALATSVVVFGISRRALQEGRRWGRALLLQKQQLEVALRNMSQGLCMFDAEQRLVVCNARFAEMYGLSPDQVKPGTSVQEVLAFRVANGCFAGAEPSDYVREQMAVVGSGTASDRILELKDGRFIFVKHRPMPGGGWVATHEDISTLRAAQAAAIEAGTRAKQAADEAREAHVRLREAFEAVPEGLVLFDAEDRYVLWNKRYAELYGESEVAAGKRFEDVVREGIRRGQYPGTKGREEEWLAERLARFKQGTSHHEQELPNGRWVRVEERRTAEGGAIGVRVDITELKEREAALRTQNLRFDTVLSNMSEGVCLFDADQRLVVCNSRYAQIYGLPPELTAPGTTLRQILEYRIAHGVHDAAYGRDIETKVALDAPVTRNVELNDGRIIAIKHRPVPGGGWVSTHEDITEREQLSVQLRQQKEQLNIALENMSQGLAMFDRDQHVIMCNKRYAGMYGLTLDQVKPGTPLRKIVAHRIANGFYAGASPEDYMRERLAPVRNDTDVIHRLSDGRTIALAVRVMPDGSGVATHTDITERENLQGRLDAALNNMAQGLAMFDAQQRLVICNKRFADMYGLAPEQVMPGNSMREIIEACIANGNYVGASVDEILAATTRQLGPEGMAYYTTTLGDGRVHGVSVAHSANGGTITTHDDITERRRIEERMAHLAHHDALTELANRVLLRTRLSEALVRAHREDRGVAVLCLDLDRFKEVNDTLGHAAGDTLLKTVAQRLRCCVRETDTIARLGGDEFAVVQLAADPPREAAALAARIIEELAAPHVIDGHQLVVKASVGIAVSPSDGDDPEQLLKCADLGLYGAKSDGRGTYRFFESEMNTRMQARRALETDLRQAIEKGQLALHYQPLLDLRTDQVCGCEALLRWHHPARGKISPAEFIPVAEATGLIVSIGEWALREACREAADWPANTKVAVNLSAVQFKSRNLAQTVVSALAASGLSPGRLELEITESALLADGDATFDALNQLHALGVRIALDDFGTGYSSLGYLRRFPFDKIKIDRCFINDTANETTNAIAILRTVAQLGASLGMTTTAEGVETQDQLELVRREGCTEMQGYLLSPPVPATEVRQFLRGPAPSAEAAGRRRGPHRGRPRPRSARPSARCRP